jgi:hypothetical protein
MSEMAARCRACGYEQETEFAPCPVCGGGSCGWWCGLCREWRESRLCPVCGGLLVVPREVVLGAFPAGTRVPVRFAVRNPGRRPVGFTAVPADPALSLPSSSASVRPGGVAEVVGTLTLGTHAPGRRTYPVRIEAAFPLETRLVVDVVPTVVRLEFTPPEIGFRNPVPGKVARRVVTVRNAGNVPLTANLHATEPWLRLSAVRVELAPGATASLTLRAKPRNSDHGLRSARLRAVALSGHAWEAPVRLHLPEPELEAPPVDLGLVRPDRATFATVSVRNVGKVRVACVMEADQPWLAVTPRKVSLPPGGEKVLRLRAKMTDVAEGPCHATLTAAFDGRQLLAISVSAECHVPKAVLAPVRKPAVVKVATDASAVRRFTVCNTGDGRLDCTITADAPWVEVLTPQLKVGPGKKRRVELRLDAPRMPLGLNTAAVRVRSNGGAADVPLSVKVVEPSPELELLGDAELGTVTPDGAAAGTIAVRNVGVGLLSLRAEPEDARVMVMPAETTVAPGPPKQLAVAVGVEGLGGGEHTFGVRFTSNGGNGRTAVRFRLPVELLDIPSLIDLGDRPAGRLVGEAVRVRNAGPDPVSLRVRADHPFVRPGCGEVAVKPGELVAVPFSLDLPPGVYGPVGSVIRVEGRTVKFAVAVRAVARRVEVALFPQLLDLGELAPGEERAVTFLVSNRGEMPAEVREVHAAGELEVWVRRQRVEPGTTATVAGRVRMNAKGIGKKVRATVRPAEEATLRLTATVGRPVVPRVIAAVAGVGGVAAGAALGATLGWFFGVAVAVAGVVAAVVFLRVGEGG